jgi:DNA-binding Xre family transcriptional regulator
LSDCNTREYLLQEVGKNNRKKKKKRISVSNLRSVGNQGKAKGIGTTLWNAIREILLCVPNGVSNLDPEVRLMSYR